MPLKFLKPVLVRRVISAQRCVRMFLTHPKLTFGSADSLHNIIIMNSVIIIIISIIIIIIIDPELSACWSLTLL